MMADGKGKFPPIPAALLEVLEARFPDRAPSPEASERAIWLAVGAVGVTRLLRQEFEKQNKTILARE